MEFITITGYRIPATTCKIHCAKIKLTAIFVVKTLNTNILKPYTAIIVKVFMEYNVYLLATDPKNPCRDVIHSRDTGLKIRVYCLDNEQFTANENEIQLFGYADRKLYAFETIDIRAEDALDVVGAIQWYAEYMDCPDMEILPDDPRPGKSMAI